MIEPSTFAECVVGVIFGLAAGLAAHRIMARLKQGIRDDE